MEHESLRRPRVIVADFHQETNSFNPQVWSFPEFQQDTFLKGKELLSSYGRDSGRVLCGILKELQKYETEIIPACALRATSGGRVDHAVVDYFLKSLLDCYDKNRPVDAIIMSLHGATQSTQQEDVFGYILSWLRKTVGRKVILSVGCDMHANITQACIENADYICGFQTYPHVDQTQTGIRASRLVMQKIKMQNVEYIARVYLPMIVPASGYSTKFGPMRDIMERGHMYVREGLVRDFSVFQMQPWLDVHQAGSAVLTISEDADAASSCAQELAQQLFDSRQSFWPHLYSQIEVIELAKHAPKRRPVVLVDFADSPGAGALGSSAAVLKTLQEQKYPVHTAMLISDQYSARQAAELGQGKMGQFLLGRDCSPNEQSLVSVEAKIISVCDGVFYQEGPVGSGQRRNLGQVAILRVENIDILVCEHACGTGDLQSYRSFGIDPVDYQMVVVKANTSFRASYESITDKICMTDTPGIGTAYLTRLPYQHIPHPFYPFELLQDYKIDVPQVLIR